MNSEAKTLNLVELFTDQQNGDTGETRMWRIPHFHSKLYTTTKVKRANKYLKHMHIRLSHYQRGKEYKKIWQWGDILMRRSSAFQIMCFHRTNEGWFWRMPIDKVKEFIKRTRDLARNKSHSLKVIRSYIPKPNGKTRPIGAPHPGDKAFMYGLTEILKMILEPQIGNYQNGFLTGRDMYKALWKVTEGLLERKLVFQFDLKSYFNTVNVQLITGRINQMAPGLGKWLAAITFNTFPRIREYQPESEVEKLEIDGVEMYRKRGFIQGAPFSPILSMYALEYAGFGNIEGLIMYADDGIIMRKEKEFTEFPATPKTRITGIAIADKALGWSMKFKFLGIIFNLWERNMSSENSRETIRYMETTTDEIKKFIKKHAAGYQRKGRNLWWWEPYPESYVGKRNIGRETKKIELKTKERMKDRRIEVWETTEGYMTETTHVTGRDRYYSQMESTLAVISLLDYTKELRRYKRKQVAARDYNPPQNASEWNDVQEVGKKIWIRYPHDWGTINTNKLQNLIQKAKESKLKKIIRKANRTGS